MHPRRRVRLACRPGDWIEVLRLDVEAHLTPKAIAVEGHTVAHKLAASLALVGRAHVKDVEESVDRNFLHRQLLPRTGHQEEGSGAVLSHAEDFRTLRQTQEERGEAGRMEAGRVLRDDVVVLRHHPVVHYHEARRVGRLSHQGSILIVLTKQKPGSQRLLRIADVGRRGEDEAFLLGVAAGVCQPLLPCQTLEVCRAPRFEAFGV
mmetsp:Transcript_67557/g.159065  ORF Transcript_67557/g.159065 Transcript_67557/m.159065 type:complete len:206 (-) Transcript_67557:231-848(-)